MSGLGAASRNDLRVSVRNLSKAYDGRRGEVLALSDVSLDVTAGEMLVLLGPSGCGKTTLLRCIAGLEHPTAGEITVHGQRVYSAADGIWVAPEKRRLSMVFQSYALWPHMTVFQNVAYPLKVLKVKDAEIAERVQAVLVLAGLEALAKSYPGQMSGGQQQRVALARALIANDGLILFDEPLSNLDAKVRERLRDELIGMQQKFGFTGLYVTHDQVEAAALADRIAVMEVGRIAQLGRPTQIFNTPGSRYVADFVGCTNVLAGTVAGADGASVDIDTPIGRLKGTAEGSLAAGAAAKVMFRPEHGQVVGEGASGPNLMSGRVERSVFLGSHVEYQVKVGEEHLALRAMEGVPLAAGDAVRICVDPARLRIFPN